jgi:hypothetical protein
MAFFVACVAWFVAIFASTDPKVRMDRTCLPVEYSGRVGTSSMMLIKADWAAPTHEFFEGVNYGCKFVLWRMFYEESWNSAQPAGQAPAAISTVNQASNQSAERCECHRKQRRAWGRNRRSSRSQPETILEISRSNSAR